MTVSVIEQGTLESSNNTEITNRVRGFNTVTWVIPGGSVVEEGDELVRLDTKVVEEAWSLTKTNTHIATATLERSRADVAKAEIAIDAYLKGRYLTQKKALENQVAVAERNLAASQTMLVNSKRLFEEGYVTALEVESNSFTVTQAELELDVAKTGLSVLENFTKKMELETLRGNLTASRSKFEADQAGLKMEKARRARAKEDVDNCVIRAKRSGLVIYPSAAAWKDTPDITQGATVRKDQVMLLMPDLSQMQVKVGIHESIIHRVKTGLRAIVRLPEGTVEAEVSEVAEVTRPAGWWTGNVVKYDTVIRIPPGEELKPGMSAEVEVILAEHKDVLTVPVSSVIETQQGDFVWLQTQTGVQRQAIRLGDTNDVFIEVQGGLTEGDPVVLNPLAEIADAQRLAASTMESRLPNGESPASETATDTPSRFTSATDQMVLTHTVDRGDVLVTVIEQGTLESSENTEIKCKVRGQNTVTFVVENGTYVEPGDLLVQLDTLFIDEQIAERTKYALWSRSGAEHSAASVERAKLAVEEYIPKDESQKGRFATELMTLEKDLAIAEANVRTAQNRLSHSKMMAKSGYLSKLDEEERTFAVERSKLNVEQTKTQIQVLKNFTRAETVETLRGNLSAIQATHQANVERAEADASRRDRAVEELGYCEMRAERSGLVIHPSAARWKNAPEIEEGGTVHKDQVLLLMPDLSQMQVTVGVHESIVDRISKGLEAIVRLPNRVLHGTVDSVASVTSGAGWWTGNVVKYDTVVRLPPEESLKPGMSAEVEIIIARHEDVIRIPVAAVLETVDGNYTWVRTGKEHVERRILSLGDSNDVYLVVNSGVDAGEEVVLNPLAHIAEAQREVLLPRAEGEQKTQVTESEVDVKESQDGPLAEPAKSVQ